MVTSGDSTLNGDFANVDDYTLWKVMHQIAKVEAIRCIIFFAKRRIHICHVACPEGGLKKSSKYAKKAWMLHA